MTKRDRTDPDSPAAQPDASHPEPLGQASRRRARLPTTRLLLLASGMAGTVAALVFWATGHAGLAIRVLAGDVVLIVAALLLL